MTVPTLTTRRPTGKPPWPMLLIAGVEKAGKSYSGALLSASDLVDRTFWIEIGEGAADQYGSIPGARYEIVEHDGSYTAIANAVHAATRQPRNDRPHAIVIDSITELWDLLSDEAQATANRRARAKAAERKQTAPTGDAQITMDLWNTAKKRWRRVIDDLRVYDGPVVLLARLELVAVMDAKGKPDASGAREWKVRAEKNLPFECDAIVKMTAPQTAALTGVRSTVLSTPPGEELPLPQFTIDGLLRSLGLDAAGATSQRSYTAPQVEDVDALGETDRPAQRNSGPAEDDQWTTPPPSPLVPTADPKQIAEIVGGLRAVRDIDNPKSGLAAVSAMVRRNITDLAQLTQAEARSILVELRAEDAEKQKAAPSGQPATTRFATPEQLTKIRVVFNENGVRDRDEILRAVSTTVGRPIETTKQLTLAEASLVIETYQRKHPGPAPADEGISVVAALTQIIDDAHTAEEFDQARADIEREHAEGAIGVDELAALQAQWTDRRNQARQAVPA